MSNGRPPLRLLCAGCFGVYGRLSRPRRRRALHSCAPALLDLPCASSPFARTQFRVEWWIVQIDGCLRYFPAAHARVMGGLACRRVWACGRVGGGGRAEHGLVEGAVFKSAASASKQAAPSGTRSKDFGGRGCAGWGTEDSMPRLPFAARTHGDLRFLVSAGVCRTRSCGYRSPLGRVCGARIWVGNRERGVRRGGMTHPSANRRSLTQHRPLYRRRPARGVGGGRGVARRGADTSAPLPTPRKSVGSGGAGEGKERGGQG
ncbi:hypothetical protein C8R47DRAFT_290033 [Mycena vitilis]|nr:hypothetical protein C8R47DRAFT_290033 [Mycena vitilis]